MGIKLFMISFMVTSILFSLLYIPTKLTTPIAKYNPVINLNMLKDLKPYPVTNKRAKPIMIDPGLYSLNKSEIWWVIKQRSLPTAFKLYTGSRRLQNLLTKLLPEKNFKRQCR
ncbi:hypothetical protein NC651_030211 [Populus alba x Populus x berolinensis]|nr:hypothetical protein NC651_030211 [Populus alba x Populus x berolinensis]